MSSTVPEQPASGRFQPGELVNVHIPGARYEGVGLIGEHAVRVDGDLFDLPLTAVIERVAPKEWPPQPGDIWIDRNQNEWAAMIWDRDVRLYQVDNDGSTREWPETVANAVGPMRLIRRRDWTPDQPAAEPAPAEHDPRAEKVAGLRAFADLLESRPDVPLPYSITGQIGFQGEEGLAEARRLAQSLGAEMGEVYDTGHPVQLWARSADVSLGGGVRLTLYVRGLGAPAAADAPPADQAGEVGGETVEDAEDQS